MGPEAYTERRVKVDDWDVRLTSYKLGDLYYCQADNVSPGAWLARTNAATREAAEQQALQQAREKLLRTRRVPA